MVGLPIPRRWKTERISHVYCNIYCNNSNTVYFWLCNTTINIILFFSPYGSHLKWNRERRRFLTMFIHFIIISQFLFNHISLLLSYGSLWELKFLKMKNSNHSILTNIYLICLLILILYYYFFAKHKVYTYITQWSVLYTTKGY